MNASLPLELEALRKAVNYQRWIADAVTPYVGERILEVGSGLGSMSRWLPLRKRLVLTECEPMLLEELRATVRRWFDADPRVAVAAADVARELPDELAAEKFDTVVSFNVLEHIEDDVATVARLARLLQKGGASQARRIVSFVPAHPWAFGTIDTAYGHVRRYSSSSFAAMAARACPGGRLQTRYFNLFGLLGWILMGRILRRRSINTRAIDLFENLCPYIRGLDDAMHTYLKFPAGQSLLAVITIGPP
jgi:SAM-dependent methyltransferase